MIPLLIFALFYSGSCERQEERQSFIIQNNSSNIVVPVASRWTIIDTDPGCMKPSTQQDEIAMRDNQIPPNSSKNMNGMANLLVGYPHDTLYIYLYNRIDIDNMPCDEFREKNPIQKRWAITKSDAESMNWTLIYTPEK